MSHMQTWTHKIHHGLNLEEAITFPFIIFFVHSHEACTKMSFGSETSKLGIPKFSKLRLLQLWKLITFCANLQLKCGLKQSCSPCRKFSNNMWQTTYTQVNQSDFWLLVVRSEIDNLIPSSSFGHNLCFKYSNGACEPILNIYVLRFFECCKDFFNLMSFDPYNFPLKIQESIETSTPKVGIHLGCRGSFLSHFPTLPWAWNVTLGLHSWPTPLQTMALVMNPRLGLQQQYPCKFQNICYRIQRISWIPYKGYFMCIEYS